MPLMLLLLSPAWAARVYWTSPPTPEQEAAVARTVPGAEHRPLDELAPSRALGPEDAAAVSALGAVFAECRGLVDVFDGELDIMAKLSKATADVEVLRGPADRQLLYDALVLEGYAAHRYFQGRLGTDPLARPYRVGEGAEARVRAWAEAAALYRAGAPAEWLHADPAAQVAYDDVQAWTRVMPSVTFVVGPLAEGAHVWLDGEDLGGAAGTRVLAAPGLHHVHVAVGETLLQAEVRSYEPGSTVTLGAPVGPAELAAVRRQLGEAKAAWDLPPAVGGLLAAGEQPVYLADPASGGTPALYRVEGGHAEPQRLEREATPRSGAYAQVGVGIGWASSGDWFLLHAEDGAPYSRATVNAVAPAGLVTAGVRAGWFAAGAGVEGVLPAGPWHTLPSGDGEVGALTSVFGAVGTPWAQATVGFEAPWYLGVGVLGHVPTPGVLGVVARVNAGVPIARPREEGPVFEPSPAWTAWAGLSFDIGG